MKKKLQEKDNYLCQSASLRCTPEMNTTLQSGIAVTVQSLTRVRLFVTPMDCSPPGSPRHGILQAGRLEWVAISSSRGSSPPRDRTCISCIGRQILNHCTIDESLCSTPEMRETL